MSGQINCCSKQDSNIWKSVLYSPPHGSSVKEKECVSPAYVNFYIFMNLCMYVFIHPPTCIYSDKKHEVSGSETLLTTQRASYLSFPYDSIPLGATQ